MDYLTPFLALMAVLRAIMCCPTDCSSQAGVSCDIISSDTACPYKDPPVVDNPGQLKSVDILPISNGLEAVGLNITWNHISQNAEKVSGYEIQYWSYLDFNDPSISVLNLCTLYNFTSQQNPEAGTPFFHTCVSRPTRMIKISTQPQANPDTDYLHRVTVGYTQDHGLNTASWQPPLVVIHNDSCNRLVDVQLYLAPNSFNFIHYSIALADMADHSNNVNRDVYVDPSDVYITELFSDVKDGTYKLYIVAEPNDRGEKCRCVTEYCDYPQCSLSMTGAFYIQGDHPKCLQSLTTVSYTTKDSAISQKPPLIPDSILIMMYILIPVGMLLAIAILIMLCRKRMGDIGLKNMLQKLYKPKEKAISQKPPLIPDSILIMMYILIPVGMLLAIAILIMLCRKRMDDIGLKNMLQKLYKPKEKESTQTPSEFLCPCDDPSCQTSFSGGSSIVPPGSLDKFEGSIFDKMHNHNQALSSVSMYNSPSPNGREDRNIDCKDSQATKEAYSINHQTFDQEYHPPADLSNYESISDYNVNDEIINSNESQSVLFKKWTNNHYNKDLSRGISQEDSGLPSSCVCTSEQSYNMPFDMHTISSRIPLGKDYFQGSMNPQADGVGV